jgi:lysyl-tRNA synthetase class 2
MAIRVQGKAGFAQLQQGGQRFQIYVRKDDVGEDAFALYKLLDLGDHIGVRGHLFRTRTGELTVHVEPVDNKPAITFLAKAMLALPDKYHGLEDTELRYRQRYVDLFMNTGATKPTTAPTITPGNKDVVTKDAVILSEAKDPCISSEAPPTSPETTDSAPPNVRDVFVKRAAILRAIRTFFDHRGYLEVETTILPQVAGGAAAQPFPTHDNALDMDIFLRIEPTLSLKRLVVGTRPRLRDQPQLPQRRHQHETQPRVHHARVLSGLRELPRPDEAQRRTHHLRANTSITVAHHLLQRARSTWASGQALSMREAIITSGRTAGQSRFAVFDSKEATVALIGRSPCAKISIETTQQNQLAKPSQRFLKTVSEPHLIQPTIIYDFPAVSALQEKPDEPDWVGRFGVLIGGFEVGNAFSELNDPVDQLARFEQQMTEKERGDREAHQMDEDYVRALGYGLPPTAGEGIGIDRLTMILTNSKSIRDVILFPLLRPQTKQAETGEGKHGESAE